MGDGDDSATQAILTILMICVGFGMVSHYLQNQPTRRTVQIAKDNGITKSHVLFWTRYTVDAGKQQYQTAGDHIKTVVTNDRSKIGHVKIVTIVNKNLSLLKHRTFIKYVAHK